MKKIALTICMLTVGFISFSQSSNNSVDTPYLKTGVVPDFKVSLIDGSTFTKQDLPKGKAVVIMYFSPDCGHCQIQTQEIMDSMQYFKDVFFVLAAQTHKKIPEIKEFSEKYKLGEAKNIRIGKDTDYFLFNFFKVRFTPFLGVYDKEGKLLKAFPQGAKIEELRSVL